ncbi:MAG TPA: quinone oxidoreductase [Thermoanaerobaculia bacterium]|nr:quinone oxidoreductase [Thermoanaerobaculia bacterium]
MKALCFDHFGGPEVLTWRDLPDPAPEPGHAIVRTAAIGLNFADIYRRRGDYHLAGAPPYILGYEAAGVVESVGPGEGVSPGDRVGFADSPFANALKVKVPVDRLIPLPADVDFETAASLLLQGLTAQYLTRDSHPLRAGETAVVHAAAGGVGLLLVQIAKRLGARVFGLTSSETKRAAAFAAGADAVFLYDDDWPADVLRETGDRGADVVYDSVGTTLPESFAAARIGGHVVFFGMAGGRPAPVDPAMLMDTSKRLTGGDLWNVLTSREERIRRAGELFEWVREGGLEVRIAARFSLAEGAKAHAYLESRGSIGKVLLLP